MRYTARIAKVRLDFFIFTSASTSSLRRPQRRSASLLRRSSQRCLSSFSLVSSRPKKVAALLFKYLAKTRRRIGADRENLPNQYKRTTIEKDSFFERGFSFAFLWGFLLGSPRRGDTDRAGRRPGRGEEKKSMLLTEVQLHLIFLCQVPRRRRADETPRRVMQNLTFFALKKRTNQHTHKKIGRARNEQVPKFPSPTGRPPRNFYHFYRLR